MVNSNSFGKLQIQLCELTLEERRVIGQKQTND